MWRKYGDDHQGVRMSLSVPFFKVFKDGFEKTSIIPVNGIWEEKYVILPTEKDLMNEMNYTSNENDLKPVVCSSIAGYENLNLGIVGKCKEPKWDIEEEIRFIVYTLPKLPKQRLEDLNCIIENSLVSMRNGADIGIQYIDIELEEESLQKMIITVGKDMLPDHKEYLKTILAECNLNSRILESQM